jgi:hypothetical protein
MNLKDQDVEVLRETFKKYTGFRSDNTEGIKKYNELLNENLEVKNKKLNKNEMIKYIEKINDIKDEETLKKYNEELKLKENKEDKQYKEIVEDVKDIKKEFKEDKQLLKE